MFKHTETIRQQEPTNCLTMLDHFVGSALKGSTKQLHIEVCFIPQRSYKKVYSQRAFTCSKLTIETLEQGVKYVQS